VSVARRAGYRLLGTRLDYLLHLRPVEWPIVAGHTALGYLLAVGLPGALGGQHWQDAALGIVLWVVCLNGGTLALNSAFDRDEGDIAYLRRPPPPPRGLAPASMALMLVGLAVAFVLPVGYRIAYAICLVMSLLYSVPPMRLKAVAGADWIINMLGFGTLTPYAGWAATGVPLEPSRGLALAAFCPLFAALYPLTQIYQLEEDIRRGDRTLATVLGVRGSLNAAIAAVAVAFALFAAAGVLAGWSAGAGAWRWPVLALSLSGWLAVLLPWRQKAEAVEAAEHQRGMYRALVVWALTDVVVLITFGG
jgi:lycopene elongase/hydratase (dihydrobisanhydrobacterioruberin-forming)